MWASISACVTARAFRWASTIAAIAAMINRIEVTSNGKKYLWNSTRASARVLPPSFTLSKPAGA